MFEPLDQKEAPRLISEFRDICIALGMRLNDVELNRKADSYEQEINRRMAW